MSIRHMITSKYIFEHYADPMAGNEDVKKM